MESSYFFRIESHICFFKQFNVSGSLHIPCSRLRVSFQAVLWVLYCISFSNGKDAGESTFSLDYQLWLIVTSALEVPLESLRFKSLSGTAAAMCRYIYRLRLGIIKKKTNWISLFQNYQYFNSISRTIAVKYSKWS